jgi:hypothetical protein
VSEESNHDRRPRIFLCHANEDKPRVRELCQQLKAVGYHPWLDEEDLLPGQDWWTEIEILNLSLIAAFLVGSA